MSKNSVTIPVSINGDSHKINALVDSGADITLINAGVIRNLPPASYAPLVMIDANDSYAMSQHGISHVGGVTSAGGNSMHTSKYIVGGMALTFGRDGSQKLTVRVPPSVPISMVEGLVPDFIIGNTLHFKTRSLIDYSNGRDVLVRLCNERKCNQYSINQQNSRGVFVGALPILINDDTYNRVLWLAIFVALVCAVCYVVKTERPYQWERFVQKTRRMLRLPPYRAQ